MSAVAIVVNKETVDHYTWGEHCDSWVLLNTPGLSVKQEQMPAGTKERLHYHAAAQQFFFVLQGVASFYIDEIRQELKAQDGLLVLPGQKHFIGNETDEALHFLVLSQPSTNNDRITIAITP